MVENSEPSTIGYKRAGMGMYFFEVFDKPMSDSTKKYFDDYCGTIYVNPKLALKWETGAIGSDCFAEKMKK